LVSSLPLARQLVLAHGWNSTAYQILDPGMEHWFAAEIPAVVGYTRRGSVFLAAGAPVCAPEALIRVCDEFEAFARQRGARVCYVCAGERMRALLASSPAHSAVVLGAQPAWDPRHWHRFVERGPSLRAQLNRSRNKGVHIHSLHPAAAAPDPDLRSVLSEWLHGRTLPPLHFLVEPDILNAAVEDRVLLTARRRGRVVAFLIASPIAARNGYLVELLARSRAAPNGTIELLIDSAMRRFAAENRAYVTLGLVALAHAADPELRRNPLWLRAMMRFARAHANRFYNFRGLEHFRTKLVPGVWEPVYAISNEPRFSVRTLYAMGAAFSGIPPWLAISIGVLKAIRAELRGALRIGS
jgi:phosphatidylglycerol lysyltransferase